MAVIFYHNDEQKGLAIETKKREEAKQQSRVFTEILPAKEFYLAEAYHQKYYLQQVSALMKEFSAIYPDIKSFVASTATARVNGYVAGYGTAANLEEELDSLGLSDAGNKKLLDIAHLLRPDESEGEICPVP